MSDIYKLVKKLDQIAEAKDSLELDPKTGQVKSWEHEGDWTKSKGKDPVGKIHNMSDRAVKKTRELSKDKLVKEGELNQGAEVDLEKLGLEFTDLGEYWVESASKEFEDIEDIKLRMDDGHDLIAIGDAFTSGNVELGKELFRMLDTNIRDDIEEMFSDHPNVLDLLYSRVKEGDLNQGAGPKFVGYLKGQDPASKRYSKYVGDSKKSSAISQGMSLVGESNMSEKDIELQDYKSMTAQEFERAYKMTKQEWINKNKALVIQNPSIKKALGLEEGVPYKATNPHPASKDPIVAKVLKQMRPGLTGLEMNNEAFLYFAYEIGKMRAREMWEDYGPAIKYAYQSGIGLNEDEVEARWTIKTEDDDGIQLQTHRRKYPSVKAAREAYKKMKPYASDFKYKATKKKKVGEDQEEHFITARPSSRGGPYADQVVMKPEHVTQVPQTGTVTTGGTYQFTESQVAEDLLDKVKNTFADYLRSVEDEVKDRELQTRQPETRDVQKKELAKDPEVFIVKAKLGPQGEHSAEIKGGFDVYVNGEKVGSQLKSVDDAKQALQALHGQMLETHKGAVASSQAGSPDDYVEE